MSIPSTFLTTTCDIYRPFGAASPTTTGVACRLVPDFRRGQTASGTSNIGWTHYLDLGDDADILDGLTRTAGTSLLNYADGDEVRVPSGGSGTRFVVVWVELRNQGTARAYKRAYLMRHT